MCPCIILSSKLHGQGYLLNQLFDVASIPWIDRLSDQWSNLYIVINFELVAFESLHFWQEIKYFTADWSCPDKGWQTNDFQILYINDLINILFIKSLLKIFPLTVAWLLHWVSSISVEKGLFPSIISFEQVLSDFFKWVVGMSWELLLLHGLHVHLICEIYSCVGLYSMWY